MLRAFRICGQNIWDLKFHKIRLGRSDNSKTVHTVCKLQTLANHLYSLMVHLCSANNTFWVIVKYFIYKMVGKKNPREKPSRRSLMNQDKKVSDVSEESLVQKNSVRGECLFFRKIFFFKFFSAAVHPMIIG